MGGMAGGYGMFPPARAIRIARSVCPNSLFASALSTYGSTAACEKTLQQARWPHGFVCSRCAGTCYRQFSRAGRGYWHCCNCWHQTSFVAGTLFASTKLSLTTRFLAPHLLTQANKGMAALELMRREQVHFQTDRGDPA
jgi:hypothetical protein